MNGSIISFLNCKMSRHSSSNSLMSFDLLHSKSPSPERNVVEKDIYDTFIDIFYKCDIKVQTMLLRKMFDFVRHPAYEHLLKTMNKDNACYIMGYLRSQRSAEMYTILDTIINSPLPTKDDLRKTLSS